MQDRLQPAVIAAQHGHECAYPVLIWHLKGLIYQVHHRKVSSQLTLDEWYAEGLEVLLKSVARYDVSRQKAKFSTYFMTALNNRATDIIRQHYSAKSQFYQNLYSQDNGDFELFELGTDQFNPESITVLRDSLSQVQLSQSGDFRRVVSQLLGSQALERRTRADRRFDQMQYRFKKAVYGVI